MGNQELITRLRRYAYIIDQTTGGADRSEAMVEKALCDAADTLESHDRAWYAALKHKEELEKAPRELKTDEYFRLQGMNEILSIMERHTKDHG